MFRKLSSVLAVLLVAGVTVVAADIKLEGVTCVISPRPADKEKVADYKEGKVFFCCGGCQAKFKETPKKFAVKANHQLVATKQYVQKDCPFSGGKVDPETTLDIGGTKVAFCCAGCKSKVEMAEDDAAKMKMVFTEKAFAKGFKSAKKKETH